MRELRLGAVILAAGAGSRFSGEPGAKLLANLDGRPVLEHVLAAARAAELQELVVVLGYGADTIEREIEWHGERRIRNPAPERGMGSSLKLGIGALAVLADRLDGAFIVLGDQPRLRADVLSALHDAAATARPADRPIVAPHYTEDAGPRNPDAGPHYTEDAGPRNPVLLLRPAWQLVSDLDDERGLGPLIEQRPEMVQVVEVSGAMPDIDTPADLVKLREQL